MSEGEAHNSRMSWCDGFDKNVDLIKKKEDLKSDSKSDSKLDLNSDSKLKVKTK